MFRNFVENIAVMNAIRKILVPVDFSQNSLKTLDYAIKIAEGFHSEVLLIWVNANQKDTLASCVDYVKEGTARLKEIIAEYTPKLKNAKLLYRIREGKVHTEVANQAKYDDVDMVICCTHGASGFEEHFIGSNAYRIVMYCDCPVITVRPNYRYRAPSHIFVLPIDSSTATRQKVTFTCRLAKIADAEIHILGLYSSKLSSLKRKVDNYVAQVEKYVQEEKIQHKTTFLEADNLTKTIASYAESVDADLIAIMTEQESSSWSFLLGTYAEQMIGTSAIPVLSVTPKILTKN